MRWARPSAPTSTSIPQYVGWQFIGHIVRIRPAGMPTSSRRSGSTQVYAAAPPAAACGVGWGAEPARADAAPSLPLPPGSLGPHGTQRDAAAGTQRLGRSGWDAAAGT